MLNGEEICKKYIPKRKASGEWHGGSKGRKTKVDFCPTFAQHVDTEQLAYNLNAFKAGDVVDMEGFLYWYEGVNTHITSVKVAA